MKFKNQTNNHLKCKSCDTEFVYKQEECFWDERGTVSTKLTRCINCNKPVVVKFWSNYYEDTNNDPRYYSYHKYENNAKLTTEY